MVNLGILVLLVAVAAFVVLRLRIEWESLNERLELVEDALFDDGSEPECDCDDCHCQEDS
jgi:hypothetical protein